MANNETTAEIGIDVVGGDLNATLKVIQERVTIITKLVSEAGNAAKTAGTTVSKDLTNNIKAMQATLSQLRTIQSQIKAQQSQAVLGNSDQKSLQLRLASLRKENAERSAEDRKLYAERDRLERQSLLLKLASLRKMAAEQAWIDSQSASSQDKLTQQAMSLRLSSLRKEASERVASQRSLETAEKSAATAAHNLRMAQIREQGRAQAQAQTSVAGVKNAQHSNGQALTAARAELGNATPERERQILAEIVALRSVDASLKARGSLLQREANSEASVALNFQKALNSAEVKRMTSLEQVAAARMLSETRIAEALAVGTSATKAQMRAATELLSVEEARLRVLKSQATQITGDNRPLVGPKAPAEKAGLFGAAGVGGIIARTAMYAAVGTAIYAVAGEIKDAEAASIEFEKRLDELGAISGSTETQMSKLGGTILDMAKNSRFSASELTEAATQLAQAGYSASGVAASLKAANDLAIGSGSSVAQSVDVMTASMGAFQLQEQDGTRVADGLTAALNKSRLALPQVALGIQYAGVTAHEQNISFEELTSAMAAMAQAGVRSGSTIGTGFRQFITDLASPTAKLSATLSRLGLSFADVDVSTIGIEQVIRNLSAAGFSAAEAYGSMEKRGAAAYLAMRSQLPVFDQVKLAMNQQGTAADAASKAADNLSGAWQRAKNRMFADWEKDAGPINKWLANLLNTGDMSPEMINLRERLRKAQDEAVAATPFTQGFTGGERVKAIAKATKELMEEYDDLVRSEATAKAVNDQFSASLEAANTRANEASEAYNAGKVSLSSFEESMQSVIQRSGSLKDGSEALTTVTVELMNRYPDLARNVDVASNSYAGLLEAMHNARGEMSLTNAALADGMAATQAGLAQENKEKGNATLKAVIHSPGFKELNPDERRDLEYWRTHANDPKALAKLSGLAASKEGDSQALRATRKLIGSMQGVMTTRVGNQQSEASAKATAAELRASQTPDVVSATNRVNALSTPGTTELTKKKLIGELTGAVAFNTKTGNTPLAAAYGHQLERAQRTLNNTGHLAEPKPVREKSVPNPKQTQAEAISIAQSQGLKIRSAGRPTWTREEKPGGPKSQETLYNTVRTAQNPVARPGTGKHEYRNGAEALDIAFRPGLTEAGLRKMYADRGFPLTNVLKESGHWHIEWNGKKRMTKANLENASSLATAREDMSEDQFAYRVATKKLNSSVADLSRATTKAGLDQSIADTTNTFNDWKKKLIASTNSEISARGFGANNAQDRLNEMQDMIQQKREEISQKIADALIKNIEAQFKTIDEAFDRSMAPSRKAIATAQGGVDGLSRYGVSKGVPDYVRVLAQKKLNQAQEAGLQAELPLKKIQLDSARKTLGDAQAELVGRQFSGQITPEAAAAAEAGILSWQSHVDELSASYANMMAQAGAPSMIVTGLTANLRQAVEAWQEVNVSTKNYNQLLGEEVGPALDTLKGSFSTFFSDIMSGSVSVGSAFGNMAKTIIRAIQDIIAKLIATKLIELLTNLALTFLGPSVGGTANNSAINEAQSTLPTFHLGSFNGGRVLGRAGGGKINTGFEGRDSTLYNLSKNEWVVRGAAARSVGDEFMRDLNDNGAHALRRRTSMSVMPPPAHQEVKVYVVAPTEKPSMGPNDVTVHMQQELLKDGATKRIIKHISQGG